MQTPSRTRPQRPLRWRALAWLTGSICKRCTPRPGLQRLTRAMPESITQAIRGMVSEVSATLVARMRRRWFPGLNTRCWSPSPSRANRGSTSVPGYRRPSSTSAHSRISRSPGRNTSTSPCGSMPPSMSTARATCCGRSSSSFGGRKNSATGNIRPGASITGAGLPFIPEKRRERPGIEGGGGNDEFQVRRFSSSRFK